MLKGARSIPTLDARASAQAWPAGSAFLARVKHRIGSPEMHGRWRLRGVMLAIFCLAVGALGGTIVGLSMAGRSAHHTGACAALNMAAAHGYLDERQQRVVMRTLAMAINPDVDSFPGGYRAMREACGANGGRS